MEWKGMKFSNHIFRSHPETSPFAKKYGENMASEWLWLKNKGRERMQGKLGKGEAKRFEWDRIKREKVQQPSRLQFP